MKSTGLTRMRLPTAIFAGLPLRLAAAWCTPSATNFCMTLDPYANETGLYKIAGQSGAMPALTVRIGTTYTFDQTDITNWYHPVGFAYHPDGAHGAKWGGAERDEVEGKGELLYKIDGKNTTCPDAGDTGLDCYEPEFFYPRSEWQKKKYKAELTITQAIADKSHGGVIYYFCHIHSKMSGKIIIKDANGQALTGLANPTEQALYPVHSLDQFDQTCGTAGASSYAPGGARACSQSFLPGTLDTDFEKCMQAIDCAMKTEMRVAGYDGHGSPIATFMQQMIPHHSNAVNMAKILLKQETAAAIGKVEDLEDILWDIISAQNYQIHQFRNYLGDHTAYKAVLHNGAALHATSLGSHCNPTLASVGPIPTASPPASGASAAVPNCASSDSVLCLKVNLLAGESGYYEVAGKAGVSPDITVKIGQTYTFDQRHASNWYHPVGFAYYADGAHGETWGAAERDEVEGAGELLYQIDGQNTTCPDRGTTGLDCYEPEFFYPRGEWMKKKYRAKLTITQAMADKSHGGVIYYFCHIHSKMSGRIIIKNADGTKFTPKAHPTEQTLYAPTASTGVDAACGTVGHTLVPYCNGGAKQCTQRFLCGTLDTKFEKCMQAIDCKMNTEMYTHVTPDHQDKIAVFMQQMIPHHENAIAMSKILLKTVSASAITSAIPDDELTNILNAIINVQTYQVHKFRAYLGKKGQLGAKANHEVSSAPSTGAWLLAVQIPALLLASVGRPRA